MDVLYIGDIPNTYHYAVFNSDYVTLYNRDSAENTTLDFYRIYYNCPSFMYEEGTTTFTEKVTFQEIGVTDKWYYRKDNLTILCFFIAVAVCTFWLVNLFTSIFKKGGLLSGLF